METAKSALLKLITDKIQSNRCSAIAALVSKGSNVLFEKYLGYTVSDKYAKSEGIVPYPTGPDSLFDLESITKVTATTISLFVLADRGKIKLTDRISKFIPRFAMNGKEEIKIQDLLSHSGGLPSDIDLPDFTSYEPEKLLQIMYEIPLAYPTGQGVRYSDLSYRILGKVVEIVAGMNLSDFVAINVWHPLGMENAFFNPSEALKSRTVGTSYSKTRKRYMYGEVADELDYHMGGIVGCDGVFMSARDLATLARIFLQGGAHNGKHFISAELSSYAMHTMTPPHRIKGQKIHNFLSFLEYGPKSYGWEIAKSPHSYYGTKVSAQAVGKAGGAGTFILLDPVYDLIAIYFTNYGLPQSFVTGWNTLISDLEVGNFFDLAIDMACQ